MKLYIINSAVVIGSGSLVYGFFMAWTPLGPIVLGILLLLAATRLGGKGPPP